MINPTKFFFLTGMFRSGTTLLARMFNSHKNITLASDPFSPIFKEFRNEILKKNIKNTFDFNAPLNDYYFDQFQNNIFHKIQESSFDLPLTVVSNVELIQKIKSHVRPYSPKIIDILDRLTQENVSDLLYEGMKIINKSYGNKNTQIIGLKEVWTNEFSQLFINNFNDAKVINIVRDPRAVIASNFAKKNYRYPITFLCRQWRKLSSLAWYYSKNNANILLIRYEDLISNPEEITREICKFLEIKYDLSLLMTDKFVDGGGKKWEQNSSYKKNSNGFDTSSINKWIQILEPVHIKLIEAFCSFEMSLLGYEFNYDLDFSKAESIFCDYEEISTGIADWIKPYSNYVTLNEGKNELARFESIINTNKINKNKKNLLALNEIIYDKLHFVSSKEFTSH